jgi:hypothetical protein
MGGYAIYSRLGDRPSVSTPSENLEQARLLLPRHDPIYVFDDAQGIQAVMLEGRGVTPPRQTWIRQKTGAFDGAVFEIVTSYRRAPPVFEGVNLAGMLSTWVMRNGVRVTVHAYPGGSPLPQVTLDRYVASHLRVYQSQD